jgi:muconolactone delta-isomerase
MKILALSKRQPGVTAADIQREVVPEAERVWELYRGGALREIYYRLDRPGAVVVLECADVDEARRVLGTLPMMEAGLIDFDVIPLGPFLPLEQLFARSG